MHINARNDIGDYEEEYIASDPNLEGPLKSREQDELKIAKYISGGKQVNPTQLDWVTPWMIDKTIDWEFEDNR